MRVWQSISLVVRTQQLFDMFVDAPHCKWELENSSHTLSVDEFDSMNFLGDLSISWKFDQFPSNGSNAISFDASGDEPSHSGGLEVGLSFKKFYCAISVFFSPTWRFRFRETKKILCCIKFLPFFCGVSTERVWCAWPFGVDMKKILVIKGCCE